MIALLDSDDEAGQQAATTARAIMPITITGSTLAVTLVLVGKFAQT